MSRFSGEGTLSGWHDQVEVVAARAQAPTPAAIALLLRPDCYVAWASASARPDSAELEGLRAAKQRWFGVTEAART